MLTIGDFIELFFVKKQEEVLFRGYFKVFRELFERPGIALPGGRNNNGSIYLYNNVKGLLEKYRSHNPMEIFSEILSFEANDLLVFLVTELYMEEKRINPEWYTLPDIKPEQSNVNIDIFKNIFSNQLAHREEVLKVYYTAAFSGRLKEDDCRKVILTIKKQCAGKIYSFYLALSTRDKQIESANELINSLCVQLMAFLLEKIRNYDYYDQCGPIPYVKHVILRDVIKERFTRDYKISTHKRIQLEFTGYLAKEGLAPGILDHIDVVIDDKKTWAEIIDAIFSIFEELLIDIDQYIANPAFKFNPDSGLMVFLEANSVPLLPGNRKLYRQLEKLRDHIHYIQSSFKDFLYKKSPPRIIELKENIDQRDEKESDHFLIYRMLKKQIESVRHRLRPEYRFIIITLMEDENISNSALMEKYNIRFDVNVSVQYMGVLKQRAREDLMELLHGDI